MEKYCIGIDIDKSTYKVCLTYRGLDLTKKVIGSKRFSNTKDGFTELLLWLKKLKKEEAITESYVLEATGVYHEQLAHFLHNEKKIVHIVLPLRSKRYLQSLGLRSKTDKIDAKGLSLMGCEQNLEIWQPSNPDLLKLRSITRQIEALKSHKTSFSNQLEGANHTVIIDASVLKSLKKMITEIDKQILNLEKKVKEIVENNNELKRKFDLFSTLKGIGLMSFAVIVSETNGFALFKNQRQLVCYAGYDIMENQSGKKVGKTRISKKGNTHIRRILHMAALSSVKNDVPVLKNLQNRVYERTGIKMKGYVAVQRKLLVLMYTLWNKNEKYDPHFKTSGSQETKLLFSGVPKGTIKTAETKESAALDELPYSQSTEVLFSVSQI